MRVGDYQQLISSMRFRSAILTRDHVLRVRACASEDHSAQRPEETRLPPFSEMKMWGSRCVRSRLRTSPRYGGDHVPVTIMRRSIRDYARPCRQTAHAT